MADTFTPNYNLTLPEIGGSVDTWGLKLNANFGEVDKYLVPIGGIIMWSGTVEALPPNWAICDGTRGTPDLRNRFIVAAGSTYEIGDTGGANSVTLTTNQIPAHNHSGTTSRQGSHTHNAWTDSAGNHNHSMGGAGGHNHTTGSSGSHSHSGSANSAGNHRHRLIGGGSSGGQNSRESSSTSTNRGYTQYAGEHTHSLSINANGAHTHSVSTVGNHTHTINSNGAHTHPVGVSTVSDHEHTVTVGNTGGGQSHENRPPYYALAFIMNVGD